MIDKRCSLCYLMDKGVTKCIYCGQSLEKSPANKVIIAGGRDFDNYYLLCTKLEKIFFNLEYNDIEIVCGLAKGADLLGKRWAEDRGVAITEFPADWDKNGKSAGYLRNVEMATYATHLIAFWDGKSKGTEHMIGEAKRKGLNIRVIKY